MLEPNVPTSVECKCGKTTTVFNRLCDHEIIREVCRDEIHGSGMAARCKSCGVCIADRNLAAAGYEHKEYAQYTHVVIEADRQRANELADECATLRDENTKLRAELHRLGG